MNRRQYVRVRSFLGDGTVVLEDGREMQAWMSETGTLGVMPKVVEDQIAQLDQYLANGQGEMPPLPKISELGLDQH